MRIISFFQSIYFLFKNKLSKSTSPYYNQNTHFTYLLTAQQLSISLSKGHYDLKNIQTYSLNNDLKLIQ